MADHGEVPNTATPKPTDPTTCRNCGQPIECLYQASQTYCHTGTAPALGFACTAAELAAERTVRRAITDALEAEEAAAKAAYVAGELDRPTFMATVIRVHAAYGPCACMACREAASIEAGKAGA